MTTCSPPLCLKYGPLSWSPDGKLLGFSVWMLEGRESTTLYVVPADGGPEVQIPSGRWWRIQSLDWLQDGSGLVLAATKEQNWNISKLFLVSYPDGTERRITNDLNFYSTVTVSGDGNTLGAVQRTETAHLWVAPGGDSKQARQITTGTGKQDGENGVLWLPGGWLAYTVFAGEDINFWSVSSDGSSPRQLTTTGAKQNTEACLIPDNYIVFTSNRTGSPDIWRMDLDGSNQVQLTFSDTSWSSGCSPDGRWIVFTSESSDQPHGFGLMKLALEGGDPEPLNTGGASLLPSVSPDGKWIVFRYRGKEERDLTAVMPSDGGKIRRIFDISAEARWNPDGKDLTYIRTIGGVSNIWAQPVEGGEPRQITRFTEGLIFNFAWSKEGDLALSRGAIESDVVLIENFR